MRGWVASEKMKSKGLLEEFDSTDWIDEQVMVILSRLRFSGGDDDGCGDLSETSNVIRDLIYSLMPNLMVMVVMMTVSIPLRPSSRTRNSFRSLSSTFSAFNIMIILDGFS